MILLASLDSTEIYHLFALSPATDYSSKLLGCGIIEWQVPVIHFERK